MTNPKIDIFTQFLRYPTVFGNTVLRNFARDTITDTTVNAPKLAAFVLMSTNVAKATNYWRSAPEERERIKTEGRDWRDTLKAYQRVGLLGPLDYGLRISEGISYGQNPLVATTGVGGPVIGDIIGMTLYNRGLLETGARKIPLTGTKNIWNRTVGDVMEEYTGYRDPYTPIQEAAKKADKATTNLVRSGAESLIGREEPPKTLLNTNRILKFEGGGVSKIDPYTGQSLDYRKPFVEGGEVQDEFPVPFVKKDPKERESDALGGVSYAEQMDRLGFDKGGSLLIHPENKEYFTKFHNDVISQGKELQSDKGTVTMRIIGVQHKGKEYLIPSYDPKTKTILSDIEAKQKYLKDIELGKLKGYDSVESAEKDRKIFYKPIVEK